jgi:hypothetical protein
LSIFGILIKIFFINILKKFVIDMKQYYYFYKITNMINNHYYYGIHSTNNLNDGYMGSGKRLHVAYEKYGIENFSKEILCFFDSWEELCDYERQIVNQELVDDDECYNLILGGHAPKEIDFYYNGEKVSDKVMGEKNGSYGSKWMMKDGISKKVLSSDIEMYKSMGWVFGRKMVGNGYDRLVDENKKPTIWMHDEDGVSYHIPSENVEDELKNGKILGRFADGYERELSKDIDGNIICIYKPFKVTDDIKSCGRKKLKCIVINGEKWIVDKRDLRYINENKVKTSHMYPPKTTVRVITDTGSKITVSKDDPKYLDGTYKIYSPDKDNPCVVAVKDVDGNVFKVPKNDERLLSGELVGHTKGVKYTDEQRKKISDSKCKGQKMWVHKINEDGSYDIKFIFKSEYENYQQDGYIYGRGKK